MRILVVEDELMIRRGLANLIANHTGHLVVGEAKSGEEGLELAMALQPDLIITDIRMPGISGLDMIRAVKAEKPEIHCVILSGYSDFDYAKQAIRYGVEDYLIKPLAPEDVTKLLAEMEKKISAEAIRQMGKPEKRLKDFFLEPENKEMSGPELEALCGFRKGALCRMITAYIGNAGNRERRNCMQRFLKIKADREPFLLYCFFLENTREFVCIMEDKGWEEIKAEVTGRIIQNALYHKDWIWTQNCAPGLECLRAGYQQVREQYLYGMVLGTEQFISAERIEAFCPEPFRYPSFLEHQMQTGIFAESQEKITACGQAFLEIMTGAKAAPGQIRDAYLKMTNFILNVLQESGHAGYEKLQEAMPRKNIELALTRRELQVVFAEEIKLLTAVIRPKEDIGNYNIKRAIEYIRSHYHENISLEMVAGQLEITPEYLSTLFNREMGENFSVFVKKFRISHAKRLLKSEQKKIYEIAAAVGYADPKYFNRVFKEVVGLSPGEYRELH